MLPVAGLGPRGKKPPWLLETSNQKEPTPSESFPKFCLFFLEPDFFFVGEVDVAVLVGPHVGSKSGVVRGVFEQSSGSGCSGSSKSC